jgi:hypothetical protein
MICYSKTIHLEKLPLSILTRGLSEESLPLTTLAKTPTIFVPLQDILYNVSGSNSDRAAFVVPRRVYYDNRLEHGKPRNTVIILAEVHDDAVDAIRACELNGSLSNSVKVLKENPYWVRHHHPNHTHCVLVIQCIGLPQDSIFNGSTAKLIYYKRSETNYSRIESEKPLFLHAGSRNPSTPTRGKRSIVVCTTMYSHPETFEPWLRYIHYLKVDGVYFNVHKSFNQKSYPFLNKSLENEFAHMDVWQDTVGDRIHEYSQITKYNDCLYRHIGVFEYALFIDYDDFFNPMIANKTDIHYYFAKFFSDRNVGSVYLEWHQMKCGPIKSQINSTTNGNLTSILTGSKWTLRTSRKCAHRLSAAQFVAIHGAEKLMKGHRTFYSDGELAYVAHNRITNRNCKIELTRGKGG